MLALRGFLNGFFSASKISSDNSTTLEKALKELKLVFQHAKKTKKKTFKTNRLGKTRVSILLLKKHLLRTSGQRGKKNPT